MVDKQKGNQVNFGTPPPYGWHLGPLAHWPSLHAISQLTVEHRSALTDPLFENKHSNMHYAFGEIQEEQK